MPFRSSLVLSHLVVLFLFFHSVVSDSLQPHGLQHTKLPCPSLSPEVCTDSCPLSQWCHPTISPSVAPLLLLPSIFPSLRVGKIEGSSVLSYIETPSKITEFCLHQLQNTREKVGGILDETDQTRLLFAGHLFIQSHIPFEKQISDWFLLCAQFCVWC